MLVSDIQAVIEREHLRQKASLPLVVFDVQAADDGYGAVVLSGAMLLERQKRALLSEVSEIAGDRFVDRIVTREGQPVSIAEASSVVDIMTAPGGRTLATQLLPGERAKVLHRISDFDLILLEDGAAGWAPSERLNEIEPSKGLAWDLARMAVGKLTPEQAGALQFCDIAARYLEVPYLLGGRTTNGMDCSALTQLVYRDVCGRLLPRHSWDQKQCGQELGRSVPERATDMRLGDLLFAVSLKRGEKHVGIYFGADRVLHASRMMKRVALWDIRVFCKLYSVASWRRMITIEEPRI